MHSATRSGGPGADRAPAATGAGVAAGAATRERYEPEEEDLSPEERALRAAHAAAERKTKLAGDVLWFLGVTDAAADLRHARRRDRGAVLGSQGREGRLRARDRATAAQALRRAGGREAGPRLALPAAPGARGRARALPGAALGLHRPRDPQPDHRGQEPRPADGRDADRPGERRVRPRRPGGASARRALRLPPAALRARGRGRHGRGAHGRRRGVRSRELPRPRAALGDRARAPHRLRRRHDRRRRDSCAASSSTWSATRSTPSTSRGHAAPRIDVHMGENLAGSEVWVQVRTTVPASTATCSRRSSAPSTPRRPTAPASGSPICKKLVDAHGGTIEVSVGAGRGRGVPADLLRSGFAPGKSRREAANPGRRGRARDPARALGAAAAAGLRGRRRRLGRRGHRGGPRERLRSRAHRSGPRARAPTAWTCCAPRRSCGPSARS